MSKMTQCKSCQADIASDCKACPKCGSPNKKGGCLSTIFGVVILIGGVVFLLAAFGTQGDDKDKVVSESEKVSAPALAQQKDIPAAREAKVNDKPSKDPSKPLNETNEREKLKIKGLYVGMPSDQVMAAIIPTLKQMCSKENPPLKYGTIFDSDGNFLPEVVKTEEKQGLKIVQIVPVGSDLISEIVSSQNGEIVRILFTGMFFNADEKMDSKVFIQQFINSYKLHLIAPMAVVKSGGADGGSAGIWECALPIGVNVKIFKRDGGVILEKIASVAEENALKAKQAKDAKAGFN